MMRTTRAMLLLPLLFIMSACVYPITIDSTPPMAKARVNGRDVGTTPAQAEVPEGPCTVIVSKDGFQDWRAELNVTGAQGVSAVLVPVPPPPAPVAPPKPAGPVTSISVFVEPEGGLVTIDGVSRGRGSNSLPVTVVYPDKPTMAEVKVELPGYKTLVKRVVLERDRDNRFYLKLETVDPWYEFDIDAELLRLAVSDVVATSSRLPSLRFGARIAVLSMTVQDDSDNPLHNLVKDAMVQALAQSGFTPAERDDRVLVHLAHSGVGDSIPYRILTHHDGEERPFDYDAEILAVKTEQVNTAYPVTTRTTSCDPAATPCGPSRSVTVKEEMEVTRSTVSRYTLTGYVPTADQFLAYRILECGMTKAPVNEGDPRPEPMISRRAIVRLHVRVIDAKNGTVTWAGILSGERHDEVPVRVADQLKNPPMNFYVEPLPTDEANRRTNP